MTLYKDMLRVPVLWHYRETKSVGVPSLTCGSRSLTMSQHFWTTQRVCRRVKWMLRRGRIPCKLSTRPVQVSVCTNGASSVKMGTAEMLDTDVTSFFGSTRRWRQNSLEEEAETDPVVFICIQSFRRHNFAEGEKNEKYSKPRPYNSEHVHYYFLDGFTSAVGSAK